MKKHLWTLPLLLLGYFIFSGPAVTFAAPAFVASSSLGFSAAATSATTTMNVTLNNLLTVGCRHGTTFVAPTNVTDTIGNTFTIIQTASDTNDGAMSVYYAVSSATNANDIIRCNFASSVSFRDITVLQYSGVATSNPLDTSTKNTTSSTAGATANSGLYTTTNANDLLVSYAQFGNGTRFASVSQGMTIRSNLDSASIAIGTGDVNVSSIQTNVSTTWVNNAAGSWMVVSAAFQAAAVATVPTCDVTVRNATTVSNGVTIR